MAGRTAPPPTNRPQQQRGEGDDARRVLPFVQSARRQQEGPFWDVITQLGSSSRSVGPEPIPPLGYLRMIPLLVELQNGDAGAATVATQPDAPFSVLDSIRLTDKNGADITGPISGYQAYLADKWGAYTRLDPRQRHQFSALDSDGNGSFLLYVPVEISSRDAFGPLANMSNAQTYQVRHTVAAASQVFSTEPDTLPEVRVRAWVDAWGKPEDEGPHGPQQTKPPRHGTTQFWSESSENVTSGQRPIEVPQVGNLIRCLVMIAREDSNDSRDESVLPDSFRLEYDNNLIEEEPLDGLRERMRDAWGLTAGMDAANGLDSGVVVWPFHIDVDGKAGHERRDHYLPTSPDTRLVIRGSWNGSARVVMLLNDVAIPATSQG